MVDLQKLYETLEKIKKKIEKNKELFMKNENAVRYALINPFLEALGWDITDPDDVIPEYSTSAGRPDYVLMKNGKAVAFIGAKALYKDEDLMQYISYCVSQNVNYFITSDGARWEVYDTYSRAELPNKRIVFWDIEKDPLEEVIRKALSISKILVYVPDQVPQIKEVPKSIFIEESTKSEPEKAESVYGKIKIWIGNEGPFILKKYNEILVQTAEWLIKNKYITEKDLPIRAGRGKRYLINVTNKHENGEEFVSFKRLFNGWYILTHFSSKSCIDMSKYLLEKYGKGIPLNIKYNNK